MGTYRSVALAAAGILFTLLGSTQLAFAQGSEGLNVKPAIVQDTVTPGQDYHFSITVTNIAASPRTLTVVTKDVSGLDASGKPIFAPKGQQTSYSLSSWIQGAGEPITLAAGESRTISFTAVVPKNATPGDHFGGVFFQYDAQQGSGNGSAIGIQVGSVLNLEIPGDIVEDARIREFSTDRILYGAPVVSFTSKVENMGNVLERPRGLIQITDMFGHKVASIPVNDALAPVFPKAVRAYATSWKDTHFAIGRYQALLSLSYGSNGGQRTISATTSFWVVPLKLTASIIGALLLVILGIYLWVRMYLRKQLRAMGASKASQSDLRYYGRKYNRMGSRLAFYTVVALFLCVVLLVVLFILFA